VETGSVYKLSIASNVATLKHRPLITQRKAILLFNKQEHCYLFTPLVCWTAASVSHAAWRRKICEQICKVAVLANFRA